MAKAKKKIVHKSKKRANKYDEKLKLSGSFEDIVKALVTPKQSLKKS